MIHPITKKEETQANRKKEIPTSDVNSAVDFEGSGEERCTYVMFKCLAVQRQVFKFR